jgi:multidrug efflux pump subunit AcrA (membrane-fusion protein)
MEINGNGEEADKNVQDRHTDDIHEIITKVPSWIVRWGIVIFFAILLMAVGVSIIIKYPDTVKGKLKIESSDISKPVVITASSTVRKVLAPQGAIVKAGQPTVYLVTQDSTKQVVLNATKDGRVAYMAIVQPGAILKAGQELFTIHPVHEQFFGVMEVPASVINKLKVGQTVLVNITGYSFNGNDKLNGRISYIADEPVKQGTFLLKVSFTDVENVHLKNWMIVDAEIITQDATVFSRISKNMFRSIY